MSSPQQAPTPYMPASQPQADAAYQQGTNQLAQAGSALSSSVSPQLAQISQNVANNPYFSQALSGAQTAANTATSQVAPQQLAGATQDSQIANLATSAITPYANTAMAGGTNAYNQTQALMQPATAGLSAAPGVFNQAQSYIAPTANPLISGANQVMQTAFDPQQSLYNQQYQQMQDQQNAIDAMSGVASSPYGAGLAGNAAQNFNINWQNQQLNRQIAGLGAATSADTGAANNVANLQTSGTNNFNALTSGAVNNANSLINTGTGALNSGINTATNAITGLGGAATGANTAASDLGTAGLNTLAGAAQLPQDIYLQQQQAQLAALGSQISGTTGANALTQTAVADQGNYLNIGQTASQNTTAAVSANNQANAAASAGFGNLFGSVLGMFSFGL